MPLQWTINPLEHLFEAVADGEVTFEEAKEFVRVVGAPDVTAYRKLFDGRGGDTQMSAAELLAIGGMFRDVHRVNDRLGPVAVVIPDEKCERFSRLLGILASAKRPLLIFRKVHQARRWLRNQPLT